MNEIHDYFSSLPEGKHRVICPECLGGTYKEKSVLAFIHKRGYYWKCFRASCQKWGRDGPTKRTTVQYLPAKEIDIPGYKSYPIYDNTLNTRGWWHRLQDRSETEKPKVILHKDTNWCGLHFPISITGNKALLVEDRTSAEIMSPHYPTIALLGCNLTTQMSDYLAKQQITNLIVALDNDATTNAIRMLKKHIDIHKIIMLHKDIKDMSDDGLQHIIDKLNNEP